MDKETVLLIINTAFALPALIIALSCLRLVHQMRIDKNKHSPTPPRKMTPGAFYAHDDGTMECATCGDRFRLAIFGDGPEAYQCSCGWIFGGFGVEPEFDNKPFEETAKRVAEMKRKHGWRVGEEP